MKHIAVFGFSLMSLELMQRLQQAEHSLVFISQDCAETALMTAQGFTCQTLDFRNDDQLQAIGIGGHIDTLFCFFPTDSDNVFLTISARALAKDLTIISIVDDPESAEKLLAAGANKIIDPYEICGRKLHEMLTRPDISNILDHTVFGQHDLNLVQVPIPPGSYLENTDLSGLDLNAQYNVILIGVVDTDQGEELHFALDDTSRRLTAGDILVVLGVTADIEAFKAGLSVAG
ncbi:TrkA family potassium uptake protein [Methylovulum psychrotolerans]|jgi:voltage-gated potassium channel|uniref:potassium channel family protein n=1 Tax=Methylovulum psychrotolerans TaxID=1704499 RepID=UPI001BFFB166|nr:NAD-binding protein [Methylovulum psychrotolerans]MBT9099663.1 TrkA family potassium uptake protein [Methylovulum psychrotolerans]